MNIGYDGYLKQPASDDCVSRKELLKLYENRFIELQKAHQMDKQLGINWCINTLNELPPVTPTRKKGKWIKRENINGLEQYYQCSNCGNHCLYEYVEIGFKNAKTNYCPNCGAEMESEE